MPSASHFSPSRDATAALAAGLASVLKSGDIVLLSGGLGAGKTTFVRSLAAALGIPERNVSSPTFVIVNQYQATDLTLIHVDAYRLRGGDELEVLGWDRFVDSTSGLAAPGHILLVEWPERIAEAFGPPMTPTFPARITLAPGAAPDDRLITLDLPESWSDRPLVDRLVTNPPTRCRVTGRWVSPTSDTYPFADERAKLADLNKWFTGAHSISRPIKPEEATDEHG